MTKVGKDTVADKAGLKVGDLLRTFNGNKLSTREGMREMLVDMAPEDKLALEITRDGKDETINLRLEKR